MAVTWDDRADEILNGDAAAAVAYATPAKGVVLMPMAPLGVRDRERGTVTVTTSLGLWKKVVRIRANPCVSIAYHAREHGHSDSNDFLLVQGRATVQDEPDRAWLESITPQWERFLGPRETGWRGKLMDVYYWNRIGIEIELDRIVRWDNPECSGEPEVIGAPLPAEPPASAEGARQRNRPAPGHRQGPQVHAEPPPHRARLDRRRRPADDRRRPHRRRRRGGPRAHLRLRPRSRPAAAAPASPPTPSRPRCTARSSGCSPAG